MFVVGGFCVFMGEENFFKEKVFPPPNPHLSKTLNGGYFFIFTHLLTDNILLQMLL